MKKVTYNNYRHYNGGSLNSVSSGTTVNEILTSGLTHIRRVIIFPFYSAAENGGILPMESPFSEDGTNLASPYCRLSRFNCQLGNINVFARDQEYDFEYFINNGVQSEGNESSGFNPGNSSGLITKEVWSAYPFVLVNLSRKTESADGVPASVSLSFTNNTGKICSYHVFLEFEEEININKETGLIIRD